MKTKIWIVLLSLIVLGGVAAAVYFLSNVPKPEIITASPTQETVAEGNITEDTSTEAPSVQEPAPIKSENYALKKTATGDNTQIYYSSKATDGIVNTYWEGKANAYPNILTVDMGKACSIKTIRMRLNPDPIWAARKQTFSISGSEDDKTYKSIVESAAYSFDPATANTVTIDFNEVKVVYVKLEFTENTGATGGQIGELEIY